ncbi:DHA2 family efflux MFS transporter permease subunit [Nonomuraea soli]|uniref:EmrB/QacA subfamily drug resistance transporter n=1 Tax=Nonomuraea soli TaxID=1032476 RepID=A0A7W0HVU7_9ACTN|nr:DHA2 family efflux MFS transporter permease subunit [Nonomuraea soli]MBA2897563.1 EmrB/QacA subfamily drug resistance transporter [Nonomuraea soli]
MKWWALGAVTLGTFATYLNNNVVNVALPTIARELGLTISGLEWIVSGYVLVFAGLMLAGGRLADLYGQRRVFLIGTAIFTIASLGASFSTDGALLIAMRAVQGLGAALMTPPTLTLISTIFQDPRERGSAVGIWTAVGGLSMAFGPVTGGFISENLGWQWVFTLNVPIGVAAFALGLWAVPADARTVRRSLDLPGVAASTVALVALTFALIEGAAMGWTSPAILSAFGLTILSALAFVVIESRSAEPMIDLSLFRSRVFSGGSATMGLWSFGVFGIYFFSALWLQNVLGMSPTEAGASFIPMAILMAVVSMLATRVTGILGNGPTVALGIALMAGGVFGLSVLGADAGYLDVLPWFLLYGLGAGLLVPLTTMILGALPDGTAGVASGVLNVSREVFGLLGITVLGAILTGRQASPALPDFLEAYQFTLVIAALIVAVGVPVALWSLRRQRVVEEPPHAATLVSSSAN